MFDFRITPISSPRHRNNFLCIDSRSSLGTFSHFAQNTGGPAACYAAQRESPASINLRIITHHSLSNPAQTHTNKQTLQPQRRRTMWQSLFLTVRKIYLYLPKKRGRYINATTEFTALQSFTSSQYSAATFKNEQNHNNACNKTLLAK